VIRGKPYRPARSLLWAAWFSTVFAWLTLLCVLGLLRADSSSYDGLGWVVYGAVMLLPASVGLLLAIGWAVAWRRSGEESRPAVIALANLAVPWTLGVVGWLVAYLRSG
jgi:hypothetical protein